MDLSGPVRMHHALGGRVLSAEMGIIIPTNETHETEVHTLTKDSNRTLNMKKNRFLWEFLFGKTLH